MLLCRSVSFLPLFSNLPHPLECVLWRLRHSIDLSLMRQVVSLWYVKFWIHVPTISCSLEDDQYLVFFYIVILMSMILLYYSNTSCCWSRQEILCLLINGRILIVSVETLLSSASLEMAPVWNFSSTKTTGNGCKGNSYYCWCIFMLSLNLTQLCAQTPFHNIWYTISSLMILFIFMIIIDTMEMKRTSSCMYGIFVKLCQIPRQCMLCMYGIVKFVLFMRICML